jgi:hypothetical protein
LFWFFSSLVSDSDAAMLPPRDRVLPSLALASMVTGAVGVLTALVAIVLAVRAMRRNGESTPLINS